MRQSFTVRRQCQIHAPIERCFKLSTCIEVVTPILGMKPVEGRTSGLVGEGDTVLWRGWKFGLPQFHRSIIEAFEPPVFFRDRMIDGRFAAFEHDHRFIAQPDGSVLLSDELRFSLPFGMAGAWVARFIVVPHVEKLLGRRFALIRALAEGEGWREILQPFETDGSA
jgi:ligand-binding SRPBCC domain-containing protein